MKQTQDEHHCISNININPIRGSIPVKFIRFNPHRYVGNKTISLSLIEAWGEKPFYVLASLPG